MELASTAHSDRCLSAANVTGELEFMLPLFIEQKYGKVQHFHIIYGHTGSDKRKKNVHIFLKGTIINKM